MSAAEVDRNLLFGVLALQMDFINHDGLIAAMNAWVLEKSKPLGQILLDQHALSVEEHEVLSAVVRTHVERHRGDARQSLAAVAGLGEVRADLERFSDPDVHASIKHLATGARPVVPTSETLQAPDRRSEGDRFQILRRHASGGLGDVFVAQDRELNREVALKRIHDLHAHDDDSLQRFLLEAEITGGLEHPGIVPVYGMGVTAGKPYYAMRFIRGETLKDAIERFHSVAASHETSRRVELRRLLGRFIAVCNAVDYAHSRNVVHRDLKPSNIMLGKYGETLVVDWGLVKALGQREGSATSQEQTLVPVASGRSSQTLPGAAIGTPAFMSPEQAAGKIDEIGPASDVYSLGATLYMLLTGKEPFEWDDLAAVLSQVRAGDFVPPRERLRSVPAALEAVCLKAMSLATAERYSSAATLASDIEHWLADEPVTAFHDPVSTRAFRWIRRHRALAAGAAALVAALLVGLVVGTVVLGRVNTQIRQTSTQLQLANDEIVKANAQIQNEAQEKDRQRIEAERQRDLLARQLYVSQVNGAAKAWDERTVGRMLELLESQKPEHTSGIDLRGWEWHYLWRLGHSERRKLDLQTTSLEMMPDGQHFLCGNWDGFLMHCALDGTVVKVWKAHESRIERIKVSHGGKLAATAGLDQRVKLWDTATWRELAEYPGAPGYTVRYGMALSPDGTRLAIAADDHVHIWSTNERTELGKLDTQLQYSPAVAFALDSRRLITGAGPRGNILKLWDLESLEVIRAFEGHAAAIRCVAISPDARLIASGSEDGRMRLWDIETGVEPATFAGHATAVTQLRFSPDGERLVSSSDDTAIKVWQVDSGGEVPTLCGHHNGVIGVSFAENGAAIVSHSWDETVRHWDAASRQEPWIAEPASELPPIAVSYSGDGRFLAAGSGVVSAAWDAETHAALWNQVEQPGSIAPVYTEMFNPCLLQADPQGRWIAAGLHSGRVRTRDARGGQLLHEWIAHERACTALDVSRDGGILATAGIDRRICLWDPGSGRQIRAWEGTAQSVDKVFFSPDAALILSFGNSWEAELCLWEVSTGRLIHSIPGKAMDPFSVAFSPDGRFVVVCGRGQNIYWLDLPTLMVRHAHRAHSGSTLGLAFSPDGRRLASCGVDQAVKIWDVATRQELQTLRLSSRDVSREITSVAFSPDGMQLAACTLRGSVVVWDARPR